MAKNLQKQSRYQYHNLGSVLVVAIWVLAFFLILSFGLYGIISTQIRLARRTEGRIIPRHLALAACVYTANQQKKESGEKQQSYDNLYNLREEKEIEIGKGKLTYILVDEESKINMNAASQNIIERLLKNSAELSDPAGQKLAESIITYRTKQPLRVKEELLNIEDFDEKVFDSCKNSITIYGNGKININTAGLEALKALGLNDDLAQAIVEFRKGPDNKEATKDDDFFENTSEIITKLNKYRSLSTEEETLLASLVGNGTIDVKSSSFTIKADGKIMDNLTMKYEITLDDKGKIRNWIEY